MGFFSKIGEGLRKTRESLMGTVNSMLHAFTRIDEDLFEELEEILITGDVGVVTAQAVCNRLRELVKERGITDPAAIRGLLRETVAGMLEGGQELQMATKPSVVLVIGVNGVGKTTTIGKLALRFKDARHSVVLAAADTFRAAAADQLEIWADRAQVPLVRHAEGADPAAVVFDGIQKAKSTEADLLIVDTAGRLHNKKNLMEELRKISRIIEREYADAEVRTLLVIDATTGQNGLQQAREFSEVAGVSGIVLTKLDGTAKGGIAVAIMDQLKLPVMYIGVGEGIEDLQAFDAGTFVDAIF